jgi:ferredoxin-NADP reductase
MSNENLIDVVLVSIRLAARDAHFFEIRRANGGTLPPAEPGAHVDVYLPNGIIRQFSLTVPDPAPESYILCVKRAPESRGGTRYMFDELKVGDTFAISPPRNHFRLVEDAANTVLIAGGIGITPIWAMVQRLEQLGRRMDLYICARSRADMVYLETLETMANTTLHFDDEADGKFLDLEAIVATAPKDAHLYCCGPKPMLSAFEAATKDWPSEQVHVEYFTAKEAPSLEGGFVVELARSGKEFVVQPGESILGVLRDAGLDVPYSCEEGICGSCETTVISGIPDHRDSVLTDKERAANKTMMICCGGSKSERLILDI